MLGRTRIPRAPDVDHFMLAALSRLAITSFETPARVHDAPALTARFATLSHVFLSNSATFVNTATPASIKPEG